MVLDTPKLVPLAQRFGGSAVWKAGIEVLGFPPTWQPSTSDVLKIQEYLETKRKE